jgi:hypothetical protein
VPLSHVRDGGACPYCGATILPDAPNPVRVTTNAATATAGRSSSSTVNTVVAMAVLLVQFAPLLAGVAAGAALRAWSDDVRLYIPVVTGFAGVVVLLWRSSGAIVAPTVYASMLGLTTASRPFVRPIPYSGGGYFSPTSETGLNWVVPGVLLLALGIALIVHFGGTRLREHLKTARPRFPTLVGFALGFVLGRAGANEVAWMTRVADARERVETERPVTTGALTVASHAAVARSDA